MRISYMQSVGAGRASSSLLGPFGPHATSDLLERQISIRFPGQDEAYNTFYETTVGTDTYNLRLRRQNTQTQALARQIACSFLLPTPNTSLEEEAENTEVEFRNGMVGNDSTGLAKIFSSYALSKAEEGESMSVN